MKKVFWGLLLTFASLIAIAVGFLSVFLLRGLGSEKVVSLLIGLVTASGYYLIWQGASSLPQSQSWEWAGKIAQILCAYTAATALLNLLPLQLPEIITRVLQIASNIGNFVVLYMIALGVRDLQFSARTDLGAEKLWKAFVAYIVAGLLSGVLGGPLGFVLVVVEFAAYVAILVFLAIAARKYENSGGGFHD
ncbi:MAG: hypothetical protein IK141_05110 [Clostridia bacterium]|nr:hypothetical protein [Clostridia bacterium]